MPKASQAINILDSHQTKPVIPGIGKHRENDISLEEFWHHTYECWCVNHKRHKSWFYNKFLSANGLSQPDESPKSCGQNIKGNIIFGKSPQKKLIEDYIFDFPVAMNQMDHQGNHWFSNLP